MLFFTHFQGSEKKQHKKYAAFHFCWTSGSGYSSIQERQTPSPGCVGPGLPIPIAARAQCLPTLPTYLMLLR